MTPKDIVKQINQLTSDVIESGVCNAQNFPTMIKRQKGITEIGVSSQNNSIFLKSIPYGELYSELLKRKNYNLQMIDGALISLLYKFQNDNIVAHRLSFFPSPNLEVFQNEPELYLRDEIYLDSLDKRVVAVPLRFDFDSGEAFVPVEHPRSHLTLGQYENCRIPVSSAVSPYQFMEFIIRNFYHIAQNKGELNLTRYTDKFERSIDIKEQSLMHVCTYL